MQARRRPGGALASTSMAMARRAAAPPAGGGSWGCAAAGLGSPSRPAACPKLVAVTAGTAMATAALRSARARRAGDKAARGGGRAPPPRAVPPEAVDAARAATGAASASSAPAPAPAKRREPDMALLSLLASGVTSDGKLLWRSDGAAAEPRASDGGGAAVPDLRFADVFRETLPRDAPALSSRPPSRQACASPQGLDRRPAFLPARERLSSSAPLGAAAPAAASCAGAPKTWAARRESGLPESDGLAARAEAEVAEICLSDWSPRLSARLQQDGPLLSDLADRPLSARPPFVTGGGAQRRRAGTLDSARSDLIFFDAEGALLEELSLDSALEESVLSLSLPLDSRVHNPEDDGFTALDGLHGAPPPSPFTVLITDSQRGRADGSLEDSDVIAVLEDGTLFCAAAQRLTT